MLTVKSSIPSNAFYIHDFLADLDIIHMVFSYDDSNFRLLEDVVVRVLTPYSLLVGYPHLTGTWDSHLLGPGSIDVESPVDFP